MPDYIHEHAVVFDHERFRTAVEDLASLIEADAPESTLQSHLESHPYILSVQFAHCHHVFPKVRLGNQYEVDFFCLDIPSSGYEWWGVELETPQKNVITKTGRKSAGLEHAQQQIRDWRSWTMENLSYARRARERNGLGLQDIQPRFYGYVVIGRRSNYTDAFNAIRSQVLRDEQIEIRSWDGIISWARERAAVYSRRRAKTL